MKLDKKRLTIILSLFALSLLMVILLVLFSQGDKASILVLGFGHDMPENSPHHDGAIQFKKLVESASNGEIEIKIYPNQSLGTDPEMVAMTQKGELAFTLPPTSKIARLAPNLELLDIPYLFADELKLYQALDGSFGKFITHELKQTQIIPLYMWESGYKNFTANKELTNPNDFSGLRFRVMSSQTLTSQAINLNSFPVNVDFHKIQENIANGNIDIQENPISSIFGMKIYQEHKYLSLSRHGYLGQLLIASKSILDSLSTRHRKIILESAEKAAKYQRNKVKEYETKFLHKIKDHGSQITEFDQETIKKFITAFSPIYYEYRHTLKKYKKFLNPLIHPHLKPHAAIGLNISFTYLNSSSAIAIKRGAELAIEKINQQGGVLGRNLILLTKSHDGFPRKGIRNLKEFARDESLIALLGGMHSPVVLAEKSLIEKIKIPYLIPWAAASPITGHDNPYIFRFSVRDEYAGAKLAREANRYGKRISLLLENTPWGRSNQVSIMKAFEKNSHTKIRSIHWFDWGKRDFSKTLESIVKSKINVIIFVGNSPEAIHLTKAMHAKKIRIPIVSHWGITGGRFWHEVKDILPEITLKFLITYDLSSPGLNNRSIKFKQRYIEKYQIKSKQLIPAPFGSIHAYELIQLIAHSIRQTKSMSPQDLSKGLMKISHYQGIFRNYRNPFSDTKNPREALDERDIRFGYYDNNGNIKSDG